MKTWAILAAFVVLAALVIGAALAGWSWCKWRTDRGIAEAIQELEKEKAELQAEISDLAARLEREKGQVRVVYKTIEKEVERHEREIPDADCFGPDDVGLLNAAARGESAAHIPAGPR